MVSYTMGYDPAKGKYFVRSWRTVFTNAGVWQDPGRAVWFDDATEANDYLQAKTREEYAKAK